MLKTRTRKPRRFVPKLTCLEDRATPAVIFVTTTDDEVVDNSTKSLREAIRQANLNEDADTIILKAGVYKITKPWANEPDENDSGAFQLKHATTIRGLAASKTIIDGGGLDAVIDVFGSSSDPKTKFSITNVTIRGGVANGAIRMGNADLTLDRCVITGNRSVTNGGGISDEAYPGDGKLTLIRCDVSYNSAPNNGGGIYLQSKTELIVKLS